MRYPGIVGFTERQITFFLGCYNYVQNYIFQDFECHKRWTRGILEILVGECKLMAGYDILYILLYRPHFWYHEITTKSECVLHEGQTKREGNIWHNLGGNTIILFFNINNEYMNNRQINWVFFTLLSFKAKLNHDNRHDYLIQCSN